MIVRKLLPLAFIFFHLLLTCYCSFEDMLPDVDLSSNRLHTDIALSEEAHLTALQVERLLTIPAGHLRPVFLFHSNQERAIRNHIQDPSSRYVVIKKTNMHYFLASPWTVRRSPNEAEAKPGVLILSVDRRGIAVPILHSGFQEGALPGLSEDFWGFLNRHARLTQPEIVSKLGRFALFRV